MAGTVAKMVVALEAETSGFERRMRQSAREVEGFKKHAGGLRGTFDSLKEAFGRRSTFTEGLHLLTLGGPIIGIRLALKELEEFATKMNEVSRDWQSMSGREKFGGIAENLPIFGAFVKTGVDLREAFTGAAHAAKKMAEHIKAGQEETKRHVELVDQQQSLTTTGLERELLALDQKLRKQLETIPLWETENRAIASQNSLLEKQAAIYRDIQRRHDEDRAYWDSRNASARQLGEQFQTELDNWGKSAEFIQRRIILESTLSDVEKQHAINMAAQLQILKGEQDREKARRDDDARFKAAKQAEVDDIVRGLQEAVDRDRQMAAMESRPELPTLLQAGSVGAVSAANRFGVSGTRTFDAIESAKRNIDAVKDNAAATRELTDQLRGLAVGAVDEFGLLGLH